MSWPIPTEDDPTWDKETIYSEHEECFGKKVFLNWDRAASHARAVRRKYDRSMEPYRCKHCRGIHVGSNDQAAHRNKGRRVDDKQP